MKILVAFEESQTVTKAFRERGHEAYSCDIQECSGGHPEWHLKGDARPWMKERWDLVIAHPPCTFLTVARGTPPAPHLMAEAIALFMDCQAANAPTVAVENPTVYKMVRHWIGEPSQVIQPWHFGDPWQKRTCLWLKGLPPLMATTSGFGPEFKITPRVSSGSGHAREKRLRMRPLHSWDGSSPARSPKARAVFWPGIARAMAHQWG